MPKTKTKGKSKRNRGAQPGNKNALKHGIYADKFTAAESTKLDSKGETDLKAEIAARPVSIDQLLNEVNFSPKTITDANGNNLRDMHYLHQLNTLTAMTQSVGTLARTEYLIRGKNEGIQKSLLEALEMVRLDLGI